MTTNRLEAFSDGVLAIVITVMVLTFSPPESADISALIPLKDKFISYALSFLMVGIYWNNHHHMLQATKRVNGSVLWANHFLLFWLSLIPFTNAWMGLTHFAPIPTFLFGLVLFLSAVAYTLLHGAIVKHEGENSKLNLGRDSKIKIRSSLALYFVALPMAFIFPAGSLICHFAVAMIWLIPDKKLEELVGDL